MGVPRGPQPPWQKHSKNLRREVGAVGAIHAQPVHPWASCDNWNFNASNPCVYAGGNYNQNQNQGLFYFNYNTASNSNGNIGSRTL